MCIRQESTSWIRWGGVLTIVSEKLAKASDLQHVDIHPGRLLHVRVHTKRATLDVINCYQYALNDKSGTHERRQAWLRRLQQCLTGLPSRNALVLAGDFNSQSSPKPKVCGNWTLPVGTAHQADSSELMDLLAANSLCVLNSWTKPTNQRLATFTFGRLESQIDFVITKQAQANQVARKAGVMTEFPVACWRDSNSAAHHPVFAFITLPFRLWRPPEQHKQLRVDNEAVIRDLRSEHPSPAMQALKERARCHGCTTLAQLDAYMLQAAAELYPRTRPGRVEGDQPLQLANCAREMWGLFRKMKKHKFSAKGVFEAWKDWALFQRAHRLHKTRSQERSKLRRNELLDQAQTAAQSGDMHAIWATVKALAPKTKPRKLQLHKDGRMLTPQAELQWITEAFGERYGSSFAKTTPFPQREHPPFQVPLELVQAQLEKLQVRKAVPPGAVPSAIWRMCAEEVSGFITNRVNETWSGPQIQVEQSWVDADVALLPKGKKSASTPLDMRPIGLQHPVGKVFMKILIQNARTTITNLVKEWPQTAYVSGRSTSTAIKTVLAHCAKVRNQCKQARLNIHQQYMGLERAPCSGGLQICMDMSAAFDLVAWADVRTALELAGIDPSVQELLLQWLRQVRYRFHHRSNTAVIVPSWGLRQGCVASPVLWAVYTVLICRTLEAKFGSGWMAEHGSLYADDAHFRWEFRGFSQFECVMKEVRQVLATFRRFGMRVNQDKTKAILALTGALRSKLSKHYIRKAGEGRHLLLSPGDPRQWLPLEDQAEYLGIIVSYQNFEAQSVRHRVAKANSRRWVLAPVLHSRRLSPKYKLNIWRSCVQTSMTYGLHCMALSPALHQELHMNAMKHIRAITSDRAHVTGRTHEEILCAYKIPTVQEVVQMAHSREQRTMAGDWMYSTSWHDEIEASLQSEACGPDQDPEDEAVREDSGSVWQCPLCVQQFTTMAALKIHAQRSHDKRDTAEQDFDKAAHALHGLPICRFCHKSFPRWQTLAQHIRFDSCTVKRNEHTTVTTPKLGNVSSTSPIAEMLPEEKPDAKPNTDVVMVLADRPDVIQTATKGLRFFIQIPSLTRQFRQTCVICGQWVASHRTMKLHFQQSHDAIFQQHHKQAQRLIAQCATPSIQCHYCGGHFKDWRGHVHKCTVIWQAAVLCSLNRNGHGVCRGRRDGHVLRDGVHQELGASQQLLGHTPGEAPARVCKDGTQGRRGVELELAGRHGPGQRSIGSYFGTTCHQIGRGDQSSQAEHWDSHVDETRGGLSVAPLVQHGGGVQETTKGQSQVQPSSCSPPFRACFSDVQGIGRPPRSIAENPGPDEGSGNQRMARSIRMEISGVERSPSSPRGGSREANGVGCTDAACDSANPGMSEATCHSSVSLHAKDDRGDGLPGDLPYECVHEVRSGGQAVEPIDGPPGKLHFAATRSGLSQGRPQAFPVGASTSRSHSSLRLNMINTGNTCYMHSIIQVMAWIADGYDAPMEVALNPRVATVLKQFFKKGEAPQQIMQDIGWRMLIQGWRHDGRQQDVGEFFTFLTSRHAIPMLQGEWQARALSPVGESSCMDRGPCSQPLLLHFCDPPPGLRAELRVSDMLQFWHRGQNSMVLGLHIEPPVLVFQLCRFRMINEEIVKNQMKVTIDDTIYVPKFQGRGANTCLLPYDLKACIFHHGPSLHHGHYNSLLRQDGLSWLCDDGRRARRSQHRFTMAQQCNCYLLIYCLRASSDHAQALRSGDH